MVGIHVRRIAVIIGIPSEGARCLGRVVNSTVERRISLPEDGVQEDSEESKGGEDRHVRSKPGSTTSAVENLNSLRRPVERSR